MCVWESVWGRNCQRIECVYRKIKNKKINRSEKRDEKLGALTNHHKNYVAVKILTEIKFILV